MKTFEYQAQRVNGESVVGTLRSVDEQSLDHDLEQQGLYLTRAKEVLARSGKSRKKVKGRELITLTTQLSTLLGAGVPIMEGLRGLASRMRTDDAREIVSSIADSVQAGSSLSEALDEYPDSFSSVYRASIRAGEYSGALPSVLQSQASYLEWSGDVRSTTVQALFYPLMLVCAICALVIVMITFVLPRIVGMMPGGEENLPGPTLFLMRISHFIIDHWALILACVAMLVVGSIQALKRERTAVAASRLLNRLPRLGELLRMIAISRFARTAATLQEAGCDMLRVLDVSGEACGNRAHAAGFKRVRVCVAGGDSLSDALAKEDEMDPLLVQVARIGESTGSLDECFAKLSAYYDKEVPRMVSWFLAMMEPAILVVAGGVVAFILLAALLPMMSLYANM